MPGIDSYTKLCIVSDGIVGGETTFTDISLSAHTVVAGGDVNHSTAYPLFGFTAIEFDGTGDFLRVPDSTDFNLGTGAYTLEARGRTSVGGMLFSKLWTHSSDTWSSIALSIDNNGHADFYLYCVLNGAFRGLRHITATTDITDGAYHHIELDYTGSAFYLFVDGVSEGSVTSSGTLNSLVAGAGYPDPGDPTFDVYIGSLDGYDGFYTGQQDQIRASVGVARHTSNFTPLNESFDDRILGLCELNTPAVTLAATGTFPIVGFCEFNTPAPWVDGIGYNPIIGYVEFNAPLPSFNAAEMSLGYGEFNTPTVSLTATGSFPIYAWTEFNTPKVVSDSAGTSQVFGFCEFNAPQALLFSESGGDVRMQTSAVSLDSTGVMAYPGFGELNTPRVVLSSYGVQNILATISMTPPRVKLKAFSSIPAGYTVVKYRR